MAKTFVFIVVITAGVLIALEGIRMLNKRSAPRAFAPEVMLMSVFGGKNKVNQLRVLGRLRVVMGIFLIVIGIWAMS
ncbi:MAG: hypothetical protein E4H27_08750 [Anaerolineales bacterium]|nr:MAG: hypothetical protein E4H27_08750 [Anaerolineales bacterium]